MPKCWTCGREVDGYCYTCGACRNIKAIGKLEETIADGIVALRSTVTDGFSELTSVLEWGFGEIRWQLQQQTDVLRSIDHTLRTPSKTKANEWRLHAEELRRRGVLDESEEFFQKALNEYRLDYRIYVGIAETYLQMNKFDKAKSYLEKSLPHAPKKEIDYKSYTYRLIGHIHFCEENHLRALESLNLAIQLSPEYSDALYDFAQYSCLVSEHELYLVASDTFSRWGGNWALENYNLVRYLCLRKAILAKPEYFYLAEKEHNFSSHRDTVRSLLNKLLDSAAGEFESVKLQFDSLLPEVERAASTASHWLGKSRDQADLKCTSMLSTAKIMLKLAAEKVASHDYFACLQAKPISTEAIKLLNDANDTASKELEHFYKRRQDKVSAAWRAVPAGLLGFPLLFGIIGAISGCTISVIMYRRELDSVIDDGFLLGLLLGFLFGIYKIFKKLE